MASITFVAKSTNVPATWLQAINDFVYVLFAGATSIAQVKTALGISAFAETILDDTTAAAVRATLGSTATGDALFITASAAAARSTLSAAILGANTDITSIYLDNTGLKVKDTNASHGLSIIPGSNITADRTLTITTGDANRTLTLSGDLNVTAAATISGTNTGDQGGLVGGRVTLTSNTPITTSDVSGATTVYYTPWINNSIEYFDGSSWVGTTFSELSQTTSDNTKSPAAVANNSAYDLLVWSDSGTIRCTRGAVWTSVTNRGTGAGTAEVEILNGRLVNKVSVTNGPAAQRGLVVGSIRSDGSAQINDTVLLRDVANLHNAVERHMSRVDGTNSWAYTTATWRQANASASNQLRTMTCWPRHATEIFVYGLADNTAAANIAVGVGVDVTNANSAQTFGSSGGNTVPNAQVARYCAIPAVGSHTYAWVEISTATGTTTFYGDAGGTIIQSGIQGRVFS